jgi:hypothetical protein
MINNLPILNNYKDPLIHYPKGLKDILTHTIDDYDSTFWIINHSTNFQEIDNTLKFHIDIARKYNKNFKYYILNSELFNINDSEFKIITDITEKAYISYNKNKKTHVVITSDSELNSNVVNILHDLIKRSYIHITIRLCTNNPQIINFWQSMNEYFGYKLNILDNINVKKNKILSYNPWFLYTEQMQRVFECGNLINLFHSLDKKTLSIREIHQFSEFLVGEILPNPQNNFNEFILSINSNMINIDKIQFYNMWQEIFNIIYLVFIMLFIFLIFNILLYLYLLY